MAFVRGYDMNLSVASWNINCGRYAGPNGVEVDSLHAGIEYMQRLLRQLVPDIVTIQELPYGVVEAPLVDAALAMLNSHPYRRVEVISPSPFSEDGRSALAILSRFPILESTLVKLPTPNVQFVGKDSVARPMHPKALLRARVRIAEPAGTDVYVVCGHMLPFKGQRRAPGEAVFDTLREALRRALEDLLGEGLPLVVCADLNMNSLEDMLPGFMAQRRLADLIGVPTRWLNGQRERSDHVLVSCHWAALYARVVPSRFDHDLCFAELVLDTGRGAGMSSTLARQSASANSPTVKILHLSDLHYGEASQGDVDWKIYIKGSERQKRVDRLPIYLQRMPQKADFLVVSGDITLAGDGRGLDAFQKVLLDGVKSKNLPPTSHTVLVPGNHDVDRRLAPRTDVRWQPFHENFGAHFVVPWLPVHERPDLLLRHLRETALEKQDVIGGGQLSVNSDTGLTERAQLPFTFDRHRRVLIYAFNSSLISGTEVESGAVLQKYIEGLQTIEPGKSVNHLLKDLDSLRKVDPARIEHDELSLFHDIVALLRQRLPEQYEDAVKIAVLHHHVTPFISEEVKQFELLINAGRFKKSLVQAGFSIVMHGHKHWDDMVVDSALSEGGQLLVVSGGTIGGWPARGEPGFNWIELSSAGADVTVNRYFVPIGSDSVDDAVRTALAQPAQSRTMRVRTRPGRATAASSASTSLANVANRCEEALLAYMIDSSCGVDLGPQRFAGWNNYIGDTPMSVLGTAFCCRALLSIDSTHYRFLEARESIVNFLLSCRRMNGFWSSTANREPGQPLETALVLSALLGLGCDVARGICAEFTEALAQERWPKILESTYGVTQILEFVLRHDLASPVIPRYADLLRKSACLGPEGGILGWSASTAWNIGDADGDTPSLLLAPSVAHTAFALAAMARAQSHPSCAMPEFRAETRVSTAFLLAQPWAPSSESIPESEGKELLCTHSTGNAALEALLLCGVPASHERLVAHVSEIVSTQDAGLWHFGSIQRPSWRIMSNLAALKFYASHAQGLAIGPARDP